MRENWVSDDDDDAVKSASRCCENAKGREGRAGGEMLKGELASLRGGCARRTCESPPMAGRMRC